MCLCFSNLGVYSSGGTSGTRACVHRLQGASPHGKPQRLPSTIPARIHLLLRREILDSLGSSLILTDPMGIWAASDVVMSSQLHRLFTADLINRTGLLSMYRFAWLV